MKRLRLPEPRLIAVLAILLAGLAASAQVDASPTLLQRYQFNGDFTSATSGGVTAVDLSTGPSVGTTNGIAGGAAIFDGVDDLLLIEGQGVLPAGAVTFAFWEKATDLSPDLHKGYFICDAAANPLNNLYLRRANVLTSGGSDVSAANGMIASSHFSHFAPQELSTGVWHQHTITYTDAGVGYWWTDGVLQTVAPSGDAFAGLTTGTTEGLVLGNRLAGDRQYTGLFDEVQIYQGSVHGGMAQYLYNNPGATLTSYLGTNPGMPDAPGARPTNATVRHWKFDGDLTEEGGTVTGQAIGNAVAGTTNGVYAGSGAVAFDGDDDGVLISKDVISTNKYSISLWTKDVSGYQNYLFCDSDESTSAYANLLIRRSSDQYSVWAGGDDFTNFDDPNTGAPATYDEWHHVVVAVDGEWGNIRVYIDGTEAMFENIEADWGTGEGFQALAKGLFLGNRAGLGRDYAGLMDDLQIYNWNISEEDAGLLFANPGMTLMDVPEPSSLVLLLAAAVSLLLFRRQ